MKKQLTTSEIFLVAESLKPHYFVRIKSGIHSAVKTEGIEKKYNSAQTHTLFR